MSTAYKKYLQIYLEFVNGITAPIRTLDQARKYIPAYLRNLKKTGHKATTIKNKASALVKLYGCSIKDFDIKLQKRLRADRDFSTKNQQAIDFFQRSPQLCLTYMACGLRKRKELAKITCDDFCFTDNTGHIVGKNERPRRFAILPGLEYLVKEFVDEAAANGYNKPFCKIPAKAPIHHLRRMYACLWYLSLARPIEDVPRTERYYCKSELCGLHLDRTALLQVSHYLGHGRPSITVDYIAAFVSRDIDGQLHICNPLDLLPDVKKYVTTRD